MDKSMQEHIQNCYRLYDITQYSLEFHIVSTILYIHSFGILIKNNYLWIKGMYLELFHTIWQINMHVFILSRFIILFFIISNLSQFVYSKVNRITQCWCLRKTTLNQTLNWIHMHSSLISWHEKQTQISIFFFKNSSCYG